MVHHVTWTPAWDWSILLESSILTNNDPWPFQIDGECLQGSHGGVWAQCCHLQVILSYDWSILTCSHDLWLVNTDHMTTDWSIQITWPLIGQYWSPDLNTDLFLVNTITWPLIGQSLNILSNKYFCHFSVYIDSDELITVDYDGVVILR